MAKTMIFLIFILIFTSCSDKKKEAYLEDNDQYLEDVTAILKKNCIGCHDSYQYSSNKAWMKSGLVVAGDLKKSLLYRSLKGAHVGGRENMPPSTNKEFSSKDVEVIKEWILNLKKVHSLDKKVIVTFEGNKLKSKELIKKCITHLTQKYYSSTSFKNCDQAVDSLNTSNGVAINDPFKLAALRNFQFLHNSFYRSYNFNKNNENWGTFELFDASEMAYGITASLFMSDLKFRDLFKGESLYGPIRIKKHKSDYLVSKMDDKIDLPQDKFEWLNGNDDKNKKKWSPAPTTVERGELKGFRKYSPNRNIIFDVYKSAEEGDSPGGIFKLHKGYGGGILGSTSYAILNYSNNFFQVMDDKRYTMRNWSKSVFSDYLCRDLPVLFKYDGYSAVEKESPLPFRRSASCMQCHRTIDPLAKAVSFVSLGHNNVFAKRINLKSDEIGALQTIIPFDVRQSGLKNLYKTDQKGEMIYRNYKGEIVALKFSDLDDLGIRMLDQLDPYLCISKRYLEYFTNLSINLDQLINQKDVHTPKERYIYNELIKLAKELKNGQSLKQLIKSIFNHDLYQSEKGKFQVKFKE